MVKMNNLLNNQYKYNNNTHKIKLYQQFKIFTTIQQFKKYYYEI